MTGKSAKQYGLAVASAGSPAVCSVLPTWQPVRPVLLRELSSCSQSARPCPDYTPVSNSRRYYALASNRANTHRQVPCHDAPHVGAERGAGPGEEGVASQGGRSGATPSLSYRIALRTARWYASKPLPSPGLHDFFTAFSQSCDRIASDESRDSNHTQQMTVRIEGGTNDE